MEINFEQIKDLGGLLIALIILIWYNKAASKKNEELMNKLDASHKEEKEQLINLIKEQDKNHSQCTQNYLSLAAKLEEVIRNNTEAFQEIKETMHGVSRN